MSINIASISPASATSMSKNSPSIKINQWCGLSQAERELLLRRPDIQQNTLTEQVKTIISDVRARGDVALFELSKRFDSFSEDTLKLPTDLQASAKKALSQELKQAIDEAYERIYRFHMSARPSDTHIETAKGVSCQYRYTGFQHVGLYIPGGSAPLISTVLMTGIPAQIAGVQNIQLCSPTQAFAAMHPGILYAAEKCGINDIYCIGGAQAIAALAYGTETVSAVQKIYGPGNAWVTEAKQQVAFDPEGAAIDMPAGPSEVLVIADYTANPQFVAMDLLSQLEHGPDSQAVLLSPDGELLNAVKKELTLVTQELSRGLILERSIKNIRLLQVENIEEAIVISNRYAPEHLLLQVDEARSYIDKIFNTGSLFLGHYTPESLGDYCSGTNHVLPTYGFARAYNGLSVMDYMQRMTIQEASQEGIRQIGQCAMVLADAEGLDAHKRAVELRLAKVQ